jgi:hypothetical protein
MGFDLDSLKVAEISGEGARKKVDHIIERNHYLQSVPFVPTKHRYLITFGLKGVVGAAAWGKPVARMEDQEDTVELLRFWTADSTPKNTESKALGYMMRDMKDKGYERLIAYASEGENHEGTIYRATNWEIEKRTNRSGTWENRSGRNDRDKADKIKFCKQL